MRQPNNFARLRMFQACEIDCCCNQITLRTRRERNGDVSLTPGNLRPIENSPSARKLLAEGLLCRGPGWGSSLLVIYRSAVELVAA